MEQSINTLKSYFERGDKPTQEQFIALIESFFHKSAGLLITSITSDEAGNVRLNFHDGSSYTLPKYILPNQLPISLIAGLQTTLDSKVDKVLGKQLSAEDFTSVLKAKLESLQNYTHPVAHSISEITGLQTSLDSKVSKTADETIAGAKIFSQLLELNNGLKFTNFSGSGINNLVVQNDGTVAVQALATDVFLEKTTYDDATKKLKLELVNGTSIEVDLSGLEEDLTGLQANITALQNTKLEKGAYTGTAQDLNNAKRDKTAQSKSITDTAGNLELVGDVEAPVNDAFYGTNYLGSKTFVKALDVLNFLNVKKEVYQSSIYNFTTDTSEPTNYIDESLNFVRGGKYAFVCTISASSYTTVSDFIALMQLDNAIEIDKLQEELKDAGLDQRAKRTLFGVTNVTAGQHNFKLIFNDSENSVAEIHKAELLVFKIAD